MGKRVSGAGCSTAGPGHLDKMGSHTLRAGHSPSIAFRHLPPNSARFGYVTEGALFISAQLSTADGIRQRPPEGLATHKKQPSAQAPT